VRHGFEQVVHINFTNASFFVVVIRQFWATTSLFVFFAAIWLPQGEPLAARFTFFDGAAGFAFFSVFT
jgi:hypothetical protein